MFMGELVTVWGILVPQIVVYLLFGTFFQVNRDSYIIDSRGRG
jgi:hypothetical protein